MWCVSEANFLIQNVIKRSSQQHHGKCESLFHSLSGRRCSMKDESCEVIKREALSGCLKEMYWLPSQSLSFVSSSSSSFPSSSTLSLCDSDWVVCKLVDVFGACVSVFLSMRLIGIERFLDVQNHLSARSYDSNQSHSNKFIHHLNTLVMIVSNPILVSEGDSQSSSVCFFLVQSSDSDVKFVSASSRHWHSSVDCEKSLRRQLCQNCGNSHSKCMLPRPPPLLASYLAISRIVSENSTTRSKHSGLVSEIEGSVSIRQVLMISSLSCPLLVFNLCGLVVSKSSSLDSSLHTSSCVNHKKARFEPQCRIILRDIDFMDTVSMYVPTKYVNMIALGFVIKISTAQLNVTANNKYLFLKIVERDYSEIGNFL